MIKIHESDLYPGVKAHFERLEYEVKGEVNDCDVVAIKDKFMVIIEMKTTLNLEVILQATMRQKLSDLVYIAVPKKKKNLKTKRFKEILMLLARLEIGLLLVTVLESNAFVEEVLTPKPFSIEHSKRASTQKRRNLLKEFHGRHGDYNIGGVTRTTILTVYKEKAIHIATILRSKGVMQVKDLKILGTDALKTNAILRDNHYGWFNRVSKGCYELTEKGQDELFKYPELVNMYQDKMDKKEKEKIL